MTIAFEQQDLRKDRFPYDPRKVEGFSLVANTLELELRTPASYAPYEIEVLLGITEGSSTELKEGWGGTIPLQRLPEYGPDKNYLEGKGPEDLSEEEAIRRYQIVCDRVKAGEYRLHGFERGRMQIELTDLIF